MIKLISKKCRGKRKQVFRRGNRLIHNLQDISHQKRYSDIVFNDEVTAFSQIVEQIEVIQENVLPGISKLDDSAPGKKQGDQTQFSPKKKHCKIKKMDLILPIIFAITPTDGSCYRVISSSIPQELFHP